jgi:hypothetical protein
MKYKFTFASETDKQIINIEDCDVYSDLLTYNKILELKLPNGGRARLKHSFHKDLLVSLRNKIRLAYDAGVTSFNVDDYYEEVLSENNTKYFFGKGSVLMPELKSYVKRIYSTGHNFFYKDQDQDKWIKVQQADKNNYVYIGEE